MTHVRDWRRQVHCFEPWAWGTTAGDRGQIIRRWHKKQRRRHVRRWHKKQRRRHVRRWNQRETIRHLNQYAEDRWQAQQDDAARLAEAALAEYEASLWCDDPEWSDYHNEFEEDRAYWYDLTHEYFTAEDENRQNWWDQGYARDIHCWIVPDYWCQTHGRDAAECLY